MVVEGRHPDEHLVDYDSEGPTINAVVGDTQPCDYFWCYVVWSADDAFISVLRCEYLGCFSWDAILTNFIIIYVRILHRKLIRSLR